MSKDRTARTSLLPRFTWWDWFLISGFAAVSIAASLLKGDFRLLSFTGGLCSVLCVIFGAKGSRINFLFGLAGSLIQGFIAWSSGLYAYAALFLLYNVPMQFIGFSQWRKRHSESAEHGIKTRWMSWWQRLMLAILSSAGVILIHFMLLKTGDSQPWSDALATTVAIAAQLLLTFAFIEQWFMWIIVNASTIVMWSVACFRGEPYALIMLIQSIFYMMNSIYGIILWSRMEKKE